MSLSRHRSCSTFKNRMKTLLSAVLVIWLVIHTAGCSDWGMGVTPKANPAGPRGSLQENDSRLSGPSYIPTCYMRGRTLVMVYEKEQKYYDAPLDDIRFDLRPRRHNSFSYTEFKEFESLDAAGLIKAKPSIYSAWYREEKEIFELSKSDPEILDRGSFNTYPFELSAYELANTRSWTSFLITDPEGFDRVIYIRTKRY
jgi:hypothetical protein